MKRIDLLVNPWAGRGRAPQAAEVARAVLEARGFDVALCLTRSAEELIARAAAPRDGCDALVAVGGDGTLNAMVGAAPRDLAIGQIPLGTANIVARELKIPLAARGAAALIALGRTRVLDLGRLNGRPFLATCGAGFDGEIIRSLQQRRRGPIGFSSYLRPIAELLRHSSPPRLEVSADGALYGRFHDLIVCNMRCYAGFFEFTPSADPSDGRLDWSARHAPGRLGLIRWAIDALRKRPSAAARYGRAERLSLRQVSGEPIALQADGEAAGTTPATIEIEPAALRFLC